MAAFCLKIDKDEFVYPFSLSARNKLQIVLGLLPVEGNILQVQVKY